LALKGHFAVSGNDAEGACAVFSEVPIGSEGDGGNASIGGCEHGGSELPFEILSDRFDGADEIVQFVDIEGGRKLALKGSGNEILVVAELGLTMDDKGGILWSGGHD